MPFDDDRRALREQMRAQRIALGPRERLAAADAVASRLRQLDAMRTAAHVAGYWAVRGELPLHALLSPRPAFAYCLPCLVPGQQLAFARWRAGDALVANRFGIPEPDVAPADYLSPAAMDLVLVPLLAFDRRGNRLGSGAGYYDRSFAFLLDSARPPRPLLVGVAYAFQQVATLPAESWDVPLDFVVTESEVLDCRRAS